MRRPGVEPGSTAWKATMLTVTPPTLAVKQRTGSKVMTRSRASLAGQNSCHRHAIFDLQFQVLISQDNVVALGFVFYTQIGIG